MDANQEKDRYNLKGNFSHNKLYMQPILTPLYTLMEAGEAYNLSE